MQNDTKYLLILTITEWIFLITFFFCLYLARTADHTMSLYCHHFSPTKPIILA